MTDFLADLEALFWGNPDGKYAVLKAYKDAGVDLAAVLNAVQSGGGGGGATTLDGLSDVAITTPTSGQTIRHNGTQFVNAKLGAGDVTGLGSAASAATTDFDAAGAASAAQSAAQSYADTNKLAKSSNLGDVANAATAATNLGVGTASTVQHGKLSLGAAIDPNAEDLYRASDSSTVSTDRIAAGHPLAVEQVDDSRTFSVTQSATGASGGDGNSARRLNVSPTIAAGQTMDYVGNAVGGAVQGAGTERNAAAYATHFDTSASGGASRHMAYTAHVGNLQSTGLISDMVAFDVNAMNALVGGTTLGASINNSATSLTVASASGFPTSGNYFITIDAEIMLVTAGQGTTTWTVTRAQGGTTAAAHNSGASVSACGIKNATGFALEDTYTSLTGVAQPWGFRIGAIPSQHRGKVGIGGAGMYTLPNAQLDVRAQITNADLLRLGTAPTAGTNDILERTIQTDFATTDGSAHQFLAVTLTPNAIHSIDLQMTVHRTGGTAGAANDGGIMRAVYAVKYDGTTAAQIGTTQTLYNNTSPSLAVPALGTLFLGLQGFNITGVANVNYLWQCTLRVQVTST